MSGVVLYLPYSQWWRNFLIVSFHSHFLWDGSKAWFQTAMLRSALFVWMCDCDKAAVTKYLLVVSTGRVPLKEIACLQEDRIKSAQIIKSGYFTTPAGGCDLAVGCGSLTDIWKSFLATCCRRWKERQELIYFRCLSNEITGLACSLSKTLGQCYKTWFVVLICKQQSFIYK